MKTYYHKLVRDEIPKIIEKDGKKAVYRILNDEEFKKALLAKIIEEIEEFIKAKKEKDLDGMAEEYADVMMVIHYLLGDIDNELLKKSYTKSIKKHIDKGGFDKRIFLEYVEEVEDEKI